MNIPDFVKSKALGQKSSWVTCYDFSSAKLLASTDVTGVLIGDSVMMTMYGHRDTLKATSDIIAQHTKAVSRGLAGSSKIIIADLPFLSYRGSIDLSIKAVLKLMRAGAHGVKLEGARGNLDLIRHLVDSGVPVMGHLGLTPQSFHMMGGFKVQAKSTESQELLLKDAKDLERSGCFSLVLECVPSSIASRVTESLRIPVIGIGAGPGTDGQILVWQDMLGMQTQHSPKFVRRFESLDKSIISALNYYHNEVINGNFPSKEESYGD